MVIPNFRIKGFEQLVIEIGSGDGRLLRNLSLKKEGKKTFFIGIEIDSSLHQKASQSLTKGTSNLFFINDSFENILKNLNDNSVDKILIVLPQPKYIDLGCQHFWIPIYKIILKKIKSSGTLLLVTEYLDELLQPVEIKKFLEWKENLSFIFVNLGYKIIQSMDGIPEGYSSFYLEKFQNDPIRIKIFTILLGKTSLRDYKNSIK